VAAANLFFISIAAVFAFLKVARDIASVWPGAKPASELFRLQVNLSVQRKSESVSFRSGSR
jgi:hypothetical protein